MSSDLSGQPSPQSLPVFAQKALDRCHVVLPDSSHPVGALIYEDQYYVLVKFFDTDEKAKRAAQRLRERGNEVILTRVRKGLVLWVLEPDAERVGRVVR
ncbi:MAG: hypothetical protein WBA57_00745 [Elainellaceae cyanobacterium]